MILAFYLILVDNHYSFYFYSVRCKIRFSIQFASDYPFFGVLIYFCIKINQNYLKSNCQKKCFLGEIFFFAKLNYFY